MKEHFMQQALKQAQKAYSEKEIPIGAIIVKNGEIISKAYNNREKTKNPCGHAEILAINKAAKKLNDWRLNDCEMYVTIEPCMMCTGAIVQARLKKIYIGALDSKFGAIVSNMKVLDGYKSNHKVEYEYGILENECSNIMKEFFRELRKG